MWNRINEWFSPDFGLHVLWIAPLLYLVLIPYWYVVGPTLDGGKGLWQRFQHNRQLKKWRSDPEIARVRKLSGQDK